MKFSLVLELVSRLVNSDQIWTQGSPANFSVVDCVPTICSQKSIVADYMDEDGAISKPETLGEVIDQIERMRDELLAIQKVLEKMEVAEPLGEQEEARIKKTGR